MTKTNLYYLFIGMMIVAVGKQIDIYLKTPKWHELQYRIGSDTRQLLSPIPTLALESDSSEGKLYTTRKVEQEEVQPKTVEELIREVFGEDSDRAIEIAKCESGLRADAWNENTNGSVDVGVFQINSVHGIRAKWLLNPEINIRVAYQIFTEQGNFSAWVCDRKI